MVSSSLPSPVLTYLEGLHRRLATLTDGAVATYIPELARANPDWFGICLATANGNVYEVGDARQAFTIQSISKPFVYGMALEDHGRKEVLRKIGVEPTGDAFNSISLDSDTGRPKNPMINAGAIAASGLIAGKLVSTKFDRVLKTLSLYAGRDLSIDEAVFHSENETGHRNRAIGHMLRNFGILEEDPTPTLELYFRQCSISVTCRDLAIIAATLANRGINPLTGKQAVRGEYVESILGVMGSCGMYDYAGEWIYRVGMPAKSGVSGGIIAVLPGQLGIGVFSPRLDARGNSVRGIKICDELSRHFDLHLFNHPPADKSVIRAIFHAGQYGSSRVRTAEEAEVLAAHGSRIRVYQLQGNLTFAASETVVAEVIRAVDKFEGVIFDLKWVLSVNECTAVLLHDLIVLLAGTGQSVLFSHVGRLPLLRRIMRIKLGARLDELFHVFSDNDTALEWCENRLLDRWLQARTRKWQANYEEYELFKGLTAEQIAIVAAKLERREFSRGAVIVEVGAPADELFLLSRGQASATIRFNNGEEKRLAAFSAGMAFGEMAVVEKSHRSATVTADSDVICDVLKTRDLEGLTESHPKIKIQLMENLCLGLSRKLRKANCERAVFED